jgi:hypothetical protein
MVLLELAEFIIDREIKDVDVAEHVMTFLANALDLKLPEQD